MVWLQQFISDFIFQFAAKKAKEMGRKIAWDEKKIQNWYKSLAAWRQSCTSLLCKTRSTICSLLTTYYSAWHACLPCFFCSSFFFSHAPYFMLQFTTSSINIIILQTRPVLLLWYYPLYYDIFFLHFTFNFYIYIYKYNLKEYEHFLTTKTRITTVCGCRSGQCVRAFARALCSQTSQRSKNVLFSLLHRLI